MLPLCLLRASRSFRIFPICDSSKEGICRTDQLRLKILPFRRWSPRCWRRRWRTWGSARFVSKPSKSVTRSCFFSLLRYYNSFSCSQVQYPGCLASHLHGCHPDCLQGWLSRFLMIFLDLRQLPPPAIFLSLCAHFHCSPLPGTPRALCADRYLATMEEVSRSKMVVRDKMVATRNSLI